MEWLDIHNPRINDQILSDLDPEVKRSKSFFAVAIGLTGQRS